ncbi:MAG: acetolactate synthase large subunit [Candidatus Binataceae bacterium]
MKLTGAELIIRLLEHNGIGTIAGIPGGANLPLYDALGASAIHHVLTRHEQGAGFVAQGIARVSGRPAVCFGTSGPGATNLLTAIADAKLDSIPIVAITGQVPRAMIGTDAFQEIDTYGLTVPITKHNFLVRSARDLLRVIPEAFRIAMSGRPGPVVVDVPKDVQTELVDVDTLPEPARADAPPSLSEQDLARAADLINASKRPMLLVGAGVIASGASPELLHLIEKGSIPVAATLLGLGALPHDHRLFLGMIGMHAARFTNLLLDECDLLIGLGVRFDDRATGKAAEFCPRAKILHVDIDASELGKIKQPSVGIAADVGDFLRALEPVIRADSRGEWIRHMQQLRARHPLMIPGADDPLRPYGIIHYAAACLPEDAIITTDVGQHQMWVAQAYPLTRPRQWLTSGGLGTMGFGLPAAIGAALAAPDRTVACFSGDGSLLMNLQELATAVEQEVNVKIILLNNSHLGLVRQQQHLFYGRRYNASRLSTQTDFVAIARGFGVPAIDLCEASNPVAALAQALDRPGPYLINVPIGQDEKVYPMVPPGGANRDMIGGEADDAELA